MDAYAFLPLHEPGTCGTCGWFSPMQQAVSCTRKAAASKLRYGRVMHTTHQHGDFAFHVLLACCAAPVRRHRRVDGRAVNVPVVLYHGLHTRAVKTKMEQFPDVLLSNRLATARATDSSCLLEQLACKRAHSRVHDQLVASPS